MSSEGGTDRWGRVTDRLRTIGWGESDPRLRASWRVLLAFVLFVVVTLAMVSALAGLDSLGVTLAPIEMATVGIPLGAVLFFAVLVPWARYIDRRPLAAYGFERSWRWLTDLVVGFLAVAIGTGLWYGVGVALGWTSVELVWAYEGGPVGLWTALMVVVWGMSGAYQATLYFGLWLTNAAEGLASRGLSPRRAVIVAWAVTAVLFVLRHTPGDLGEAGMLLAGGTVFGAMYVQSGELALPIGAIGWGNFVNLVLFVPHDFELEAPVVFEVTQSLPAGLDLLADPRLPQMVIAYVVVVTWLHWRRDDLWIDTSLTEWTPR